MKPTIALQLIIIAVATTALFFLRWDLALVYLVGLGTGIIFCHNL